MVGRGDQLLPAEASAAIALHEPDRRRAVLLASIGEDVKPRLLAIEAGSRALWCNPGNKQAAGAISVKADPAAPELILNEPAVGYRLAA